MVYRWAIYKNKIDEVTDFNKRTDSQSDTQWAVYTDKREKTTEGVKMTYFASSQKRILSGDEGNVKKLAAQYTEFILSNQRKQG